MKEYQATDKDCKIKKNTINVIKLNNSQILGTTCISYVLDI